MGYQRLDEFEQEKDDDDGEDEADASAAVVAEPWSHAITTEAEHKNQDDQKDKHFYFSVRRRFAIWRCDAGFITSARKSVFERGCLSVCDFRGVPSTCRKRCKVFKEDTLSPDFEV
jgi:hypothetical protein